MERVFISFRTTDLDLATAINEILRVRGYDTYFYPDSTRLGVNFRHAVKEALETVQRIIVVGTQSYFEFADNAIREEEFRFALDNPDKLVPLRFQYAMPPEYARDVAYQDFARNHRDDGFEERLLLAMQGRQHISVRRYERNQLPPWSTKQEFSGRREERNELTRAFADASSRVVCIVANGARGKSALVCKWLDEMEESWATVPLAAPTGVFAYSFAAQGLQNSEFSAKRLFDEVLRYFVRGDPGLPDAKQLAAALLDALDKEHRPLLVLDGFETALREDGEFRDATIKWFFAEFLARPSRAKIVITSKRAPTRFEDHEDDATGPVKMIHLGRLDYDASLRLLRDSGLKSKAQRADAEAVARESEGEPLCLNLVGSAMADSAYSLNDFYQQVAKSRVGGNLDIELFSRVFLQSQVGKLGPAAVAVLYAVALFDDIAVSGNRLKELLFGRAHLPLVTAPLRGLSLKGRKFLQATYEQAVALLRKRRLIPEDERETDPMKSSLQLHGFVRKAAREMLREQSALWRRANLTIYRALVRSVPVWQPEDRSQLETLYSAIRFGVNAGRGAWTGWMYGLRCQRGYRAFSTNQKGMIGEDVLVMQHYYEGDWGTLRTDIGLNGFDRAIASSWAGLVLIGTNRLTEGHAKMKEGLGARGRAPRIRHGFAHRPASLLHFGSARQPKRKPRSRPALNQAIGEAATAVALADRFAAGQDGASAHVGTWAACCTTSATSRRRRETSNWLRRFKPRRLATRGCGPFGAIATRICCSISGGSTKSRNGFWLRWSILTSPRVGARGSSPSRCSSSASCACAFAKRTCSTSCSTGSV